MRIEIRSDHVMLEGYVNAVGRDSKTIPDRRGAFVEQVVPGTFARALGRGNAVELKLNHGRVLGSTETRDIELYEDNIGLRAKAKISDAEVIQKAKEKKLRGWSFGFIDPVDEWEERTGEVPRRLLKGFTLKEVTIIDDSKNPAYAGTSLEVRESEEALEYAETEQAQPPLGPECPAPDIRTTQAGFVARRLRLTRNGGK